MPKQITIEIPDEHWTLTHMALASRHNRDDGETPEEFVRRIVESGIRAPALSYEQAKKVGEATVPADLVTVTVKSQP